MCVIINQRIGIHREDAFTQIGFILIGELDFGQLSGKVIFEALFVGFRIVGGIVTIAIQFVKGNIVAGEELVATISLDRKSVV